MHIRTNVRSHKTKKKKEIGIEPEIKRTKNVYPQSVRWISSPRTPTNHGALMTHCYRIHSYIYRRSSFADIRWTREKKSEALCAYWILYIRDAGIETLCSRKKNILHKYSSPFISIHGVIKEKFHRVCSCIIWETINQTYIPLSSSSLFSPLRPGSRFYFWISQLFHHTRRIRRQQARLGSFSGNLARRGAKTGCNFYIEIIQ